jgi:hypothetical protein
MITMNKQRPSGTPDDVRGTMEDLARNQDDHEYHSGAWFRELTVKLAMSEDLAVSAVTSDDGRFMTWRWPGFCGLARTLTCLANRHGAPRYSNHWWRW